MNEPIMTVAEYLAKYITPFENIKKENENGN